MRMTSPRIPEEYRLIEDFSEYAQQALAEEMQICGIKSMDVQARADDFYKVEVKESMFQNCTFQNCSFEKASFVDVVFQSCDLSNSKFIGAYFDRCQFVSCKCMGVDMSETVLKNLLLRQSRFEYASFYKTKMSNCLFEQVDFTEADMSETLIKMLELQDCKLIKNNFFKTTLKSIDFSKNLLIAPILSNPPVELRGATVSTEQAVDLIGLWGITVK